MTKSKFHKIGIVLLVLLFSVFLSGCDSSYSGDYEDFDEEPITSDNWECTSDCSGHEAGYEWADEHGITDPDDCGGNSDSFIEGCRASANEHNMELEEDYYDADHDYYGY